MHQPSQIERGTELAMPGVSRMRLFGLTGSFALLALFGAAAGTALGFVSERRLLGKRKLQAHRGRDGRIRTGIDTSKAVR